MLQAAACATDRSLFLTRVAKGKAVAMQLTAKSACRALFPTDANRQH